MWGGDGDLAPITATFTGDASLNRTSMGRITDPLTLWNPSRWSREFGRLPVMTLVGASVAYALHCAGPRPLSKIAVLLAGLNAGADHVVIEAMRPHRTDVAGAP
jgi:3-phosphoshikimate 1-carboxyvinyltransferase